MNSIMNSLLWYILSIISVSLIASPQIADCGILIWSNQKIQLPSLKTFNDDDLMGLVSQLDHPQIVAFHGDINVDIESVFKEKFTAYVPNANIHLDDVVDDGHENLKIIERTIDERGGGNNVLGVVVTSVRLKREVPEYEEVIPTAMPEDDSVGNDVDYEAPTGPVYYNFEGKTMIYSSRPPSLRVNNNTVIRLGFAGVTNIDVRSSYTRLTLVIPQRFGKIHLRFKFTWESGYWTLGSVEYEDSQEGVRITMPAASGRGDTPVTAPRKFSYHCTGETRFVNASSDIALTLYDLQAQPDAEGSRFGDAYDCVPFTTAPIWSGIMVTVMLTAVLGFGLAALGSIRTMDKFDNNRTKQLTINVAE